MTSSLAVLGERATKKNRFAAHLTDSQRIFFCSETKTDPLVKTLRADLPKYEFYQPSTAFCRSLVIDIDHIFALSYIQDLPAEIKPHAVVLTPNGIQAFWLIEGVPLTDKARRAPIAFAQDVAGLLRQACNGDSAVDALVPSKCRNPLYTDAEVFFFAECPPYALKSLVKPLRAYLAAQGFDGVTKSRPRRAEAVWGVLEPGQRNETIFHRVRYAAYRGEDYEALAHELNDRCQPPLPLSEVNGIVRSVHRFMEKRYKSSEARRSGGEPVPEPLREFLAEIGRKGGSRKTEKKNAHLVKARNAASAVRSAQAIGRKAQIQELKKAGYKQREVAQKMGISIETVKRGWKAP